MENNEFKAGDLVVLKSGSALMTVERVDGDELACVWYQYGNATFPGAVVRDDFTKCSVTRPKSTNG